MTSPRHLPKPPKEIQEIIRNYRKYLLNMNRGAIATFNGLNLSGYNFERADLEGASFLNSDLSRSSFFDANLKSCHFHKCTANGTFFVGANLKNCYIKKSEVKNTSFDFTCLYRGNFLETNLEGSYFKGADLRQAIFRSTSLVKTTGLPICSDYKERLFQVALAALATEDSLLMGHWHSCETSHCIGGWSTTLGGTTAKLLDSIYGSEIAGLMLLGPEAHSHFYDSNKEGREFLQEVVRKTRAEQLVNSQ